MNGRFQFSLRQLLIAAAVLAALLGVGRWYYLNYVYAHPITAEDDLEDYVGRVVSFPCKFVILHKGPWLVDLGEEHIHFSLVTSCVMPANGQTVTIVGRLARVEFPGGLRGTYHIDISTWHSYIVCRPESRVENGSGGRV